MEILFDDIAFDWTQKRSKPWPIFNSFFSNGYKLWLEQISQNTDQNSQIILDLGAGSGRNSDFLLQTCQILIDLDESREMISQNNSKSHKIQASMDHLPFRQDIFHGIVAIASFHHIKTIQLRLKTLSEIKRVGTNKCLICISVWRFYQKKFIGEYKKQIGQLNDIELIGDVQVPWNYYSEDSCHEKRIKNRFYHLFRVSEFYKLMRSFKKLSKNALGNKKSKNNFFFFGMNIK
jgi:ubiquinone/menaquinone biosynthesis C-methylase UbiE